MSRQMANTDIDKKQSISELAVLRQRLNRLEKAQTKDNRKQMAPEQTEERLRIIIDNINDVVFQLTPIGRIHYVSPKVKEIYNYEPEDLIGKHFKKTTPISELPKALKVFNEVLSGKSVSNFEINQLNADGNIVPMEVNCSPIRKDGKIVAVQGVMRDISYRKQIEEKLRQSEEKYHMLVERGNDGIVIVQDGLVKFANAAMIRMISVSLDEILGKAFADFVSAEQREVLVSLYKRRMCGEKMPNRYEIELLHKDGRKIPLEIYASVIEYEGKSADMAIIRDITERKQAEARILETERHYRLLAENAGDAIWTIDMDMRPTYISPSITRLLGYSVEEAMAKTMVDIFTPASHEEAMKVIDEELAIEDMEQKDLSRSRTLDLELICKDGSMIPVEVTSSFVRDADGHPREILTIARDIVKRKKAEEEVKRSTEKLVKAMENTMQAIAMIIEMRDPYTAGHQRRVTELACVIAREMEIPEDQITGLRLAGIIHDIGKVRVPSEILTHPDGLTDAEFTMIKMHPILGYEILAKMDLPWPIAQIVHQHHERLNGSGYPLGLLAEEILLEAKVLAVSDVVEAIASHRPYRPARGIDKALDEIEQNKGILYDPDVVDACLRLFKEKRFRL